MVLLAIVIALGYLCLALMTTLLPPAARSGAWLPLHLALAGGAATAIAGLMPFFSVAIAAAPPGDPRVRVLAVLSVALGAAGVTTGFSGGWGGLAVLGGAVFIVGLTLTAVATARPVLIGLGPGRGLVTRGYLMALAYVSAGALLAMLFVTGWPAVTEAWLRLKPAHAWLNLVGFVTLVMATTLLHLFPTVVGARIQPARSASLTVVGFATGAPLVALGYALGADMLARVGAAAVLLGAAALAAYVLRVWRGHARWSGDPGWHRFTSGGLGSAIVWFEIGVCIDAGRVLLHGSDPAAAGVDGLIGPLVLGWVGLAIVASASHLVPAVGPGDPVLHARQRRMLGWGSRLRLGLANAGIAALAVGMPTASPALLLGGITLVSLSLAASTTLLVGAVVAVLPRRGTS